MARVRLLHEVRADWPLSRSDYVATAGVHEASVNGLGAVSVRARDGRPLGVKPGEMEWVDEPPPLETPGPREEWFRARIAALEGQLSGLASAPVLIELLRCHEAGLVAWSSAMGASGPTLVDEVLAATRTYLAVLERT